MIKSNTCAFNGVFSALWTPLPRLGGEGPRVFSAATWSSQEQASACVGGKCPAAEDVQAWTRDLGRDGPEEMQALEGHVCGVKWA